MNLQLLGFLVHQWRHNELHRALDELFADYLHWHQDESIMGITVFQLLKWSNRQREDPRAWNENET